MPSEPQPRVVDIYPGHDAVEILLRVGKLRPTVEVTKLVDPVAEVTKYAVKAEADEEAI